MGRCMAVMLLEEDSKGMGACGVLAPCWVGGPAEGCPKEEAGSGPGMKTEGGCGRIVRCCTTICCKSIVTVGGAVARLTSYGWGR